MKTQQITNRRVRIRFKLLVLVATIAAMVSAAPAMACYNGCGGGLFTSGVGAYGCGYVASGCGVTFREQLPDLDAGPQYYYVNQGPYYTGPGNIAPVSTETIDMPAMPRAARPAKPAAADDGQMSLF